MDLSRITTLHIEGNSPFLKADPKALLTIQHTFKNGIVVKPVIQSDKISHYIAHDKNGKALNVFYARFSPNDRCLLCVEDEDRKQSYCSDVDCKTGKVL
jgi:hypothetical protein